MLTCKPSKFPLSSVYHLTSLFEETWNGEYEMMRLSAALQDFWRFLKGLDPVPSESLFHLNPSVSKESQKPELKLHPSNPSKGNGSFLSSPPPRYWFLSSWEKTYSSQDLAEILFNVLCLLKRSRETFDIIHSLKSSNKRKGHIFGIWARRSCLCFSPVLSLEVFLDKTVSASRVLCAGWTGIGGILRTRRLQGRGKVKELSNCTWTQNTLRT